MRLLTVIAIVALIWLVGLFAFAHRVRELTPPDDPARADAIVALTGPSAERVMEMGYHSLWTQTTNQSSSRPSRAHPLLLPLHLIEESDHPRRERCAAELPAVRMAPLGALWL